MFIDSYDFERFLKSEKKARKEVLGLNFFMSFNNFRISFFVDFLLDFIKQNEVRPQRT